RNFQAILKKIRIVKLPAAIAKDLPMSAGLAKLFKEIYYRNLLEALDFKSNTPKLEIKLDTLEEYLSVISRSWNQIMCSSIVRHFQSFPSLNKLTIYHSLLERSMITLDKIWENAFGPLRDALKKAFPGAPESALQYFDSIEKDTGPSSFLRQKIQSMRHHPDFFHCFTSPNFGTVRIARIDSMRTIRPILTYSKGNVYVPLPSEYIPSPQRIRTGPESELRKATTELAPSLRWITVIKYLRTIWIRVFAMYTTNDGSDADADAFNDDFILFYTNDGPGADASKGCFVRAL
ncbi:hypothetical protein BGZ65_011531, partial [Modicella reniformis]